jgi:hypothetical protein
VLEALGFFALAEVVGLAAVPLAALAFGRLPGAGARPGMPTSALRPDRCGMAATSRRV